MKLDISALGIPLQDGVYSQKLFRKHPSENQMAKAGRRFSQAADARRPMHLYIKVTI
ncbi:hypothetical protein ABIB30_005036 [Pedobacter sp. UYP1]